MCAWNGPANGLADSPVGENSLQHSMSQTLALEIFPAEHTDANVSGDSSKAAAINMSNLWLLDPTGSISLADAVASLEFCGSAELAANYVADCQSKGVSPTQRQQTPEHR